jgi:pimeloyl-ACP methyl ester carboxylesterase
MQFKTRIELGAGAAVLAAAAFVHQRAWQAQRSNPPAGSFVEADGVRLHYVERGAGPPLVMLHGTGGMVQEIALSPLFELAAARYRVIVFDRPGYGYSTRPRGHWWGPQAQAELLHRALAILGVAQPIVLGHSFGAMVALAMALAHPAALKGVVLASGYYFPTGRLDVPLLAPPAIPLIGDLLRHTVSPLIGRAMWPAMLRRVFRPAPVPAYFSRFPVWMALRPSQLRAAAEESAALIPSAMLLRRKYEELERPPVIVAGAQDRYVDAERHSARLASLMPGSELLLSPRAGHMVHHTDPRRVLQAVELVAAREAAR